MVKHLPERVEPKDKTGAPAVLRLADPFDSPSSDMVSLVMAFGFKLQRTKGSHHIFAHPDIQELINLQEVAGEAKPYQIRQFLRLIERYNLKMEDT